MNAEITASLLKFRKRRGWQKYHTPKNLAEAVTIEAAELLNCFIWNKTFEVDDIADEMADIVIFLTYLCHDLGIDMQSAVKDKIAKNALKYPEGVRHEWR